MRWPQEWRKPLAQCWIHQALNPALADARQRAERDGQKVQSKSEWLAVKISPRDHLTLSILGVGDKDERVIDGGIGFGLEDLAAVRERVANGAVDLRNAAQRVGVLHAAACPVRFTNLA